MKQRPLLPLAPGWAEEGLWLLGGHFLEGLGPLGPLGPLGFRASRTFGV